MRAGVKRSTGWTHVAFVASMTDPDEQYEIKKRDNGQDGCECKSYQFSRGDKSCKHLRAYYAGESFIVAMEPAVRAAARKMDTQTVSLEGESFMIRRRALGGLAAMLDGDGPQRAKAQAAPELDQFKAAMWRQLKASRGRRQEWFATDVVNMACAAWKEVHGG